MLDDLELGRMVNRLRTYKTGGHWYYRYHPPKRKWTDEQIMEGMGLTKRRFDKLVKVQQEGPPRYFSSVEWRRRYFAFWDKHKRWDTEKDRKNWRETGLQSGGSGLWGRDGFIEDYCDKRKRMLRNNPEMVLSIPNLTTRRNVIDRLGGAEELVQRVIKKGKAKLIQQDDFGTLWELDFPDGRDTKMRYVEVINSSPQMDAKGNVIMKKGEPVYDHYFLRVPPGTTTAKSGVAWTFDKNPNAFKGFAAQS